MIQELNHKDVLVARKIRSLFQVSYAVEADLLNAIDFPPLKRSLANFLKSSTGFYGYFENNELAAVAEIENKNNNTHIQSLVVDPYYFRQGIGKKLVAFVFDTYNTPTFSVETGLTNLPAIALYKKFGFIEIKQWETNHGIRKVRFEKRT
ncbi:GNAT family N-acetyltransferase [Maribacter algarum]|uniref:GNAT family N-acetyltransferase n=1 Tax=Maribacter algarum (ex Zhang et al. 2020) TaxID=2578118 RepID=A0A5S3PI80_9FLAO|nr:GNAT family N-acetyltransferase [Maribacter algarum]TMM53912.1 GNAT family N-acetyltransferase [Maribacter algarum]